MPSDVKKRADRLWRLGNACSLLAKRQYTRSSVGLLGIRGLTRGADSGEGPKIHLELLAFT